ncbi:type VI immunity family protein [Hyalangium minutum]|uniref:type VI immunity family protein n=1 Tax=Hyalangium minutum TaxID=394096 RepID=UPI001F0A82B0|nr:type VI immunity family protein [Hyalangium minutum]
MAARDGVVICFFMRRSHPEIALDIWRALQTYVRAIPQQSLSWYASNEGDMLPLDDKGWEAVRHTLLERAGPERGGWNVELDDNPSETGDYHFEYCGVRLDHPMFSHDEEATSGVAFSFPTEYLLEHGPAHLRALALQLAGELPFSFGYASLAFVAPRGFWYSARKELLGLLPRYLGLDLYDLSATSRVIGTRARGAYWLTFLGQPLLGELGGLEGLRPKLAFPDVAFEPMEGERLLITLGEWPDPIDIEKQPHLPQYKALAHLLEPFMYEERNGWFTPLNKDNMRHWLRRLCQ